LEDIWNVCLLWILIDKKKEKKKIKSTINIYTVPKGKTLLI